MLQTFLIPAVYSTSMKDPVAGIGDKTLLEKSPGKKVLPIIILAQWFCTSLWFASNGVMPELVETFGLSPTAMGHLTAAVQAGFITGTLSFAVLSISDRFSPSRVFLVSALLGALFNAGIILEGQGLSSLLALRFLTGFFLAGIYPVGMKIASDYYREGLGKSLGFLVGALVLGTALPHLLSLWGGGFSWKDIILCTSLLAITGGILLGLGIPDGPYRRKAAGADLMAFFRLFRIPAFRSAALGYFGHMWELYAFWAFVPVICLDYLELHPSTEFGISLWSFLIIGIGSLACVGSGFASMRLGAGKTARIALGISGLCCLLLPVVLPHAPLLVFLIFMLIWGFFVIADSPMFSTLVAHNAPPEFTGTGLTIVNSAGFAVTVISIQLLNGMLAFGMGFEAFLLLALGPFLGLMGLGWGTRKGVG